MKRFARGLAAFLLVLLLPVQGLAAACAQACLKAQAVALMQAAPAQGEDAHDCHGSTNPESPGVPGEGKCCHAHTVMAPPHVAALEAPPPSPQPPRFVARWTSFIPVEPSPPPIASAA